MTVLLAGFLMVFGIFAAAPAAQAATYGPYVWANLHASEIADHQLLDVAYPYTGDGTTIHLWHDNGPTQNQRWYFDKVADHVYKFRNVQSNSCMDIQGPWTNDGTIVHQWHCYATTSQEWRQVFVKNYCNADHSICAPQYAFVNVYANKCLDARDAGWQDGTQVQIWSCSYADNQLWY
ncbi:RICIN domain-containing protein [Streptomyces sp. NPDC005708]|uniref:RICIN domain-containing protein n=1 Tax=unclassified Streptomyces TaxID=2593676 RepID=UPI0033D0ABE8